MSAEVFSDAEVLQKFRTILDRYGKGIGQNNFDRIKDPERPARATLKRRFGSWERAKELAYGVPAPQEEKPQDAPATEPEEPETEGEITEDFKQESGMLCSRSRTITTLEELLDAAKVDCSIWEVERYVINKWEVGAKDKNSTIQISPLYQIKAWLKRRTPYPLKDALEAILSDIKEHAPIYPPLPQPSNDGERYMYEIAIFDLHLASLSWAQETGEDYDTKIAEERYLAAISNLMARTNGLNIERITLPTGSDLFHVDNTMNTTTAGTRQDVDSRWQRAFQHAQKMLVTAIDSLAGIAPVDVIVIPGNHDWERMYYLGEVLSAWYRHSDRVMVDNAPNPRKYMRYGATLLGYTHGKDEKADSLPLIMAREQPQFWAETQHHEWHIGHLHKSKETKYIAGDTYCGVPVRIIPSLCGANAWHHSMGYIKGTRAAEAYLWSYDTGYSGHFSSNVVEV